MLQQGLVIVGLCKIGQLHELLADWLVCGVINLSVHIKDVAIEQNVHSVKIICSTE